MSAPIRWSAHADGACYYFVDGPAGLSAACFDSPAFRRLKALPGLEVRWANLSAGPKALTDREAHELALAERDPWLDQYSDNPSQQTSWHIGLGDQLFGATPDWREITTATHSKGILVTNCSRFV